MPLTNIPLRERKYATQKLKILDAFDKKLKEKSLADISVKEITHELEISEMTFFNYFSSKKEVLIYFIELWSLEMQILIEGKEPIASIYLIFEETAKMVEKNPNLFMEIVSAMALYGLAKKDISISKAERILRFGVDSNHTEGGFKDLISSLLEKLNLSKERESFIYTSLFNICFATPILMKCPEFGSLQKSYVEQLNFILKGIK